MAAKQILLVVNSVYQLLTAVHLKQNLLADCEADLILTDNLPGEKTYLPSLTQTRLFRRILLATTREMNRKYAIGKEEEIAEAFAQIPSHFRWILSDELADYEQVYFSNFDIFARMLACVYDDHPCEFFCYEDGFSSYVIDYLRKERATVNRCPAGQKIREKIAVVLLYEPRLAMRGDDLPTRPLPKIRRDDVPLRELLNFIFDYKPSREQTDFLFLEQSFRAEGIKSNDLSLMQECQRIVGPGRFAVKPHPRNPEPVPYQMGLTRKYTVDAPWELFLLNEDVSRQTVITVCSNAALTGRLVFGLDIRTVMLYPLFQGKVLWQEDAVLKQYLRKFRDEFAGDHYYVPQTLYELRHILEYLGGNHES